MNADFHEDDEIRLFRKEYPDVYEFAMKVINGTCDEQALQAFENVYGEELCNFFLKLFSRRASSADIKAFEEEYPDVQIPFKKFLDKHAPPHSEILTSRAPFKKGDFIGQKYEVFDVLGEGGFGIVYLVYSHETKSAYALKTFRDEYLEDIQTRERFRKEAQVWIDLERHPYLVRAYFVDEISGRLYIAMEHIAADEQGLNTLDAYLRKRPPDLAQTLRWAIQFCHGMEYAYSKGIKAHRDIKPANIMIGQDKAVKISDFGLAGVISTSGLTEMKAGIRQISGGEAYKTVAGTAFGTPPYMPPEQFENAAGCDERSDIYSFGIVLYQMASGGKLPFYPDVTGSKPDNVDNVFQDWYRLHCKAFIPQFKSPLFSVIQKCLEKEPRKRYQTFRELRADIEPILKRQTGEITKLPKQAEFEAWELRYKGISLRALGRYSDALYYFERALAIDPLNALAWSNKGAVLSPLGRYEEAIECFDEALKIDMSLSPAWSNKGVDLSNLGKYSEANECYDMALSIYSQDAVTWYNKGIALYCLGRLEEAFECYDKALRIDPRYVGAWYKTGCLMNKLGRHDEAIKCFDKALAIDPCHERGWVDKGISFQALGRDAEAISCFDKALEINPHNEFVWGIKGDILQTVGKNSEAISCYDQALAINPQNELSWCRKGYALQVLNQYEKAIKCYEKALGINPQNELYWYNKAMAESALGHVQNAVASYRRFIKLAPAKYSELVEDIRKMLRELE